MSIYFIRHAQSKFNAIFKVTRVDPIMYDSPLSDLGKEQAIATREDIAKLDIRRVIVSPFTRTLQTASLIFGDDYPFEISRHVREQLSNSCDVGSRPDILRKNYPHLDFGDLPDVWWHQGEKDHRGISVESHEILLERTGKFVESLREDDVHATAIVTHGNFIHALTDIHTDNCEIMQFDPHTGKAQSINGISS